MKSPFRHINRVIELLQPRERQRLVLVALGSIFMALIEVIGVGSIMPFMAVAAKPEIIHTNTYLRWIYDTFGFQTDTGFLVFLGVGVLGFLLLTNATQALLQYVKVRFTSMRRHTLSLRLFKGYLGQPYPFFLNRNSYDFVKNINSEIQQVITGTLIQYVDFISRVIQVALLSAFLLAVNFKSTMAVLIVVGILYGAIYFAIRKIIRRLGAERFELVAEVSRIVSEAFWGIKEVKITGTEAIFAEEYVRPSKRMAANASVSELVGDLPKFALETAAFSTIMIFVLVTILREGSFANAAATVSLFAYAGYRMIPAVQGLFKAFTKLKYGAPTAERLIAEFAIASEGIALSKKTPERLPFSRTIELKDITFQYPNVDKPVIERLSLSIESNALVGFAGRTGSGKTTLVDIILGLLRPQGGGIIVDGATITDANLRSWQANLGYVPQNIYLSNGSVAANIAFGVPRDKIDMEAVEEAARMAQIYDFVTGELKDGFATEIGERGIRLSGGQRQRIGIARALYRNPSVLIMDEATSALDNATERAVMESIDALMGKKTILLIAHRLSTLRNCDDIYLMEHGKVVDTGTYEELERRNETYFRQQ